MSLPNQYKFSCGSLETNYGQKIHALKPDADGAYEVVVGGLGCPTRNNVIYDVDSTIRAMSDPDSRFHICLQDGNLAGEYGHPVISTKEDMPRLMRIDEHYISHYFTKIWVDDSSPINIGGMEGYPIRAKVKPTGPYGEILRKQLEDPHHNTSFSIRSLCLPMNGRDSRYEYRKVQVVVTFDAVSAPGYQIATKRYVPGTESFAEIPVDRESLTSSITEAQSAGMESSLMLTMYDVNQMYNTRRCRTNSGEIITDVAGRRSVYTEGGQRDAASLLYRR